MTRYKARLVVCGFNQIPGVNYTKSFSPIATKASIYALIGFALYYNWEMTMLEVKAAFLNAKSENATFIEWPTGAAELGFIDKETINKQCIMLEKSMYGTVNAAIL